MFKKRCESYLGLYYGQVVSDPDIMSTAKDKRIRRKYFYCERRTDWFCFWCRRWLCNSMPNKTGRKAPKYFTVNTPVLDKQGRLQPAPKDSELDYESIREVGVWTCYHAAHIKAWTSYTESQQQSMLRAAGGDRQTVIPQSRKTRAVSATQSALPLS